MPQTSFFSYDSLYTEYADSVKAYTMKIQHYHDAYEIYAQTLGDRYLFLNDICHTLQPGDIYILKPFSIHYTGMCSTECYSRYLLNFRETALGDYIADKERSQLLGSLESGIYHLPDDCFEQIVDMFAMLHNIRNSKPTGFLAEKSRQAALLCFLTTLCDILQDTRITREVSATSDIQPEIIEAIRYINHHYRNNLDLSYLSDLVHMSKYHFCRLFHQTTGATFLDYLYNVRLAKVHQLLLESDMSLGEIARHTGFSSTAHLTRKFQSVYGMSPRAFRKQRHSSSSAS